MKKLIKRILQQPVAKLADKFSSRPDKERVHDALTSLHQHILNNPGKKGEVIPFQNESFIILSDQHKGCKNGADDFMRSELNYQSALQYYFENNYYYINLGDSEELWENNLSCVKHHNQQSFKKEKLFFDSKRYLKIFGNHDLYWDNDPLAKLELSKLYGEGMIIYEGAVLQTYIDDRQVQILLTHGHQGDAVSDGNWFSKWFVSNVWAPLQSYLSLNPNTPAYDNSLKTLHNQLMYEWSSVQQNTILITGHTHQPVFESLTLLERLYQKLNVAKQQKDVKEISRLETEIQLKHFDKVAIPDFNSYKPSYFNTGCCCFSNGDITGIEIEKGYIRLIKWQYENAVPKRIILEEVMLKYFVDEKG